MSPAGWQGRGQDERRPAAAGFDEAMLAALAAEGVLAADETPVNVWTRFSLPGPARQ